MFFFHVLATMPRKYDKKGESKFDMQTMVKAIKELILQNKSARAIAATYKIPRTTLGRYASEIKKRFANFAEVTDDQIMSVANEITHHANKAVIIRNTNLF